MQSVACRVLVVGSSRLLGEALARLLARFGSFDAQWHAVELLERRAGGPEEPDLVVVESDGTDIPIDLGDRIRACWPQVAMVLVLRTTGTAEQRAALTGSAGCLSSHMDERELVRALQRLHQEGRLHANGSQAPARRVSPGDDPEQLAVAMLTERETDVLRLLVAGLPAAEMALRLGLTGNTVRSHVQNVMAKLGVHSRLEAVALARRVGLNGQAPARGNVRRPPEPVLLDEVRHVNGAMAPTRVLVGDHRPVVRAALRAGLESEEGVVVVAEARSSTEAALETCRARPDVAVLDWDLPPDGGLGACAEIKTGDSRTRVLVVRESADEDSLLATVEAGADGYAEWSGGLSGLARDVRRLHVGEACIPPGMLAVLLRRLIQRGREADQAVDRFSKLSRREREILALIVEGLDNQGIARALVISPHTARTHVQNVLAKLGVHSRVEASAVAAEYGLIERFMGAS